MENAPSSSREVDRVMEWVERASRDGASLPSLARALAPLNHWPPDHVRDLVDRLPSEVRDPTAEHLPVVQVLDAVARRLRAPERDLKSTQAEIDGLIARLVAWYAGTPAESRLRAHILSVLAAGGSPSSLRRLAELIARDPPIGAEAPSIALPPLLGRRQPHLAELFPSLLEGMGHRSWAAAILDVANHAYSAAGLRPHPAASRADQLRGMLARLIAALDEVQQGTDPGARNMTGAEFVIESVSLIVSTCRALGLIGSREACPELRSALQVDHRRIRAEAAGALVQLGDSAGSSALIELAQWPASRIRVLAYAEEYGLVDQIDPQYRTAVARAEGELALWLSEPTQFGLAPTEMELVDQRALSWPGYHDPQPCFLFRFKYQAGPESWSNLGIAGPLVLATTAPLEDLNYDDVYALFAGWQALHDELYEVLWTDLPEDRQRQALARRVELAALGFQEIEPRRLGHFFGEQFTIARAKRNEQPGYLIWGGDQTSWWPDPDGRWNEELAYAVFKGRKLLAEFNPKRPDDSLGED